MQKKTIEEIQNILNINDINLKILSKDKDNGVFEDFEFGQFTANINNVIKKKQSHPNRNKTFKNVSLDEIKKRVNKKIKYLELIEFNGTKNKATFLDKDYGIFVGRFDFVMKEKSLHKERSKLIRKKVA